MAKRKRLGPAVGLETAPAPASPVTRAPIATVAGEAATAAAFDAVAAELSDAKTSGRMVMQLPLDAVEATYLIRDRMVMDAEDMDALMDSLRRRGQQTPIEVVALAGGQYGLISGARRMKALELLHTETGEARFALVQALIRQPDDRAETYVAMIEENEIRAGLSFYERARIAQKAVEAGVFETPKAALNTLFAGVSWSKRSKIKSFMVLVEALDDVLRFPAQITERQGLALVKVITQTPRLAKRLHAQMTPGAVATPERQEALIASFLKPAKPPVSESKQPDIARGIHMSARPGRVVLEGDGVNEAFIARLTSMLSAKK